MSATRGPAVVTRVGALLRAVAAHHPSGASTTEIANELAISRPTTHRLLVLMLDEGLVDRDSSTGAWLLGPELYLLGAAAADRYDVSHQARGIVRALAQETGESAFLSARRGNETVCLMSEEGSFPLRSHVLYEGLRLPLGVASAGLVILAHLPRSEVDRYLAEVRLEREWGLGHSSESIAERIQDVRTVGYATNPGLLVEGSWGMGAAVFDTAGRPAWALSLTGVESRFGPSRRPGLGERLIDAAHRLSRQLRHGAAPSA